MHEAHAVIIHLSAGPTGALLRELEQNHTCKKAQILGRSTSSGLSMCRGILG